MSVEIKDISSKIQSRYKSADLNLITNKLIDNEFGGSSDYVEYHIFNTSNSLVKSNYNSPLKNPNNLFLNEKGYSTSLNFEPDKTLTENGFDRGNYFIQYNIYRKVLGNIDNQFFIKDISPSRLEIRIDNNNISNNKLEEISEGWIKSLNDQNYYKDFLLNFGRNISIIGINVILDKSDINNYSLLIKLYEPLPNIFNTKDTFWIVEEISNPVLFSVEFIPEIIKFEGPRLRGPNFNLDLSDILNNPTSYLNKLDLIALLNNTGDSSYTKNLMNNQIEGGVKLNIDYENFENFIHFSSITFRLRNFYDKIKSIESYREGIISLSSGTDIITIQNIKKLEDSINKIVVKFDSYEQFLYYSLSDFAWPKDGNEKTLITTDKLIVLQWFGSENLDSPYYGGLIMLAREFDRTNSDSLINSTPEYILDDEDNSNYITLIGMIGHHFDDIWIYNKHVTEIYNSGSGLNNGVSKDLVSHVINSLGVRLYPSFNELDEEDVPIPSPTPTTSNTPTPTVTPTITSTPTNTPSVTPSVTPSITLSGTSNPTPSVTPSVTTTSTPSNTPSNTPSGTKANVFLVTPSPTNTATSQPAVTPTPSPSSITNYKEVDFMVINYKWIDSIGIGDDLDAYTGIQLNGNYNWVGNYQGNEYPLGYDINRAFEVWGGDILGGDNTLINLKNFSNDPSIISIRSNATWYGSRNTGDVLVSVITYRGGNMERNFSNDFTNVGGTVVDYSAYNLNVLSNNQNNNPIDASEVIYIEFNRNTREIQTTIL